jgi:hypothetical protein
MNIVFDKKDENPKPKFNGHKLHRVILSSWPILIALVLLTLLSALWWNSYFVSNESPDSEIANPVVQELDVISAVADSLGVPSGPAVRLGLYLEDDGFSGVGVFKVKPSHVGWLRDQLVPGAEVNLEDPVMNANIALGLISSFHERGYSWGQSFLIYVYGWEQLSPSTRSPKSNDFLNFVFGGDSDE